MPALGARPTGAAVANPQDVRQVSLFVPSTTNVLHRDSRASPSRGERRERRRTLCRSVCREEEATLLAEGDRVPEIAAPDEAGTTVTTKDFLGKPLVLYFYPKDDTPGCTSEANQFREQYAAFEGKGAQIVGVSRDSVASHQHFKEKYGLPYRLLADLDGTVYEAFGVTKRSTFLIDKEGTIVRVWPQVSVPGHAEDVLAAIA
ncbi:MAG: peroxiredoxin [Candidatus Eremiobacteraeota bacterium]|nr:peroxiredoxin [Candidatus Eremiobacteraeota bacterium]